MKHRRIDPEISAALTAVCESHPMTPLEVFRTLVRIHVHQVRANIRPLFPIYSIGYELGLDHKVVMFEYNVATTQVIRGYRAAIGGVGPQKNQGHPSGRTQRYVVEDPDGRSRIITF